MRSFSSIWRTFGFVVSAFDDNEMGLQAVGEEPGLDVLDAVAGGELNVVERHHPFLIIVGDEP